MKWPSVTAIIAAFNAERTVGRSIDSVLKQDYDGEVQIIVVDDASIDSTFSIASRYENVKVIRNKKNLGRAGARNRAVEAATTPLIAIQDADDWSFPSRLRTTVPLVVGKTLSIAGGQLIWEDPILGPYGGPRWPEKGDSALQLLLQGRMPVAHPALLAPTDILREVGGYNENFPIAEDLDLLLRLKKSFPALEFVNAADPVVRYYRPQKPRSKYVLKSAYWTGRVHKEHSLSTPLSRPGSWLASGLKDIGRLSIKHALKDRHDTR